MMSENISAAVQMDMVTPVTSAVRRNPSSHAELSAEEQKTVEQLKKRDAEVRRHEMAHKRAAGPYAMGGPSYEYQTGPDGKRYAVGGEVQIDTSEVPNNPEATIRKADQVKRAALAAEEPSSQDRRVAAEAERMKAKARQELAEQTRHSVKTGYTDTGETSALGGPAPRLSVYA
jgi:hypothetical protein